MYSGSVHGASLVVALDEMTWRDLDIGLDPEIPKFDDVPPVRGFWSARTFRLSDAETADSAVFVQPEVYLDGLTDIEAVSLSDCRGRIDSKVNAFGGGLAYWLFAGNCGINDPAEQFEKP